LLFLKLLVKQVAAQVGRPARLWERAEVAVAARAAMMMEYCILNVLEGLEGWFVVCGFESLCWSCSELKLLDDDELERERGEFIYFFSRMTLEAGVAAFGRAHVTLEQLNWNEARR
jgi:hypothetical protein